LFDFVLIQPSPFFEALLIPAWLFKLLKKHYAFQKLKFNEHRFIKPPELFECIYFFALFNTEPGPGSAVIQNILFSHPKAQG